MAQGREKAAMARVIRERVEMPRQAPEVRRRNFNEVALGFSLEQAQAEAERCLQCKEPLCISGCPVAVQVPDFIAALREGDLPRAAVILRKDNSLPAICGRVCPQDTQCEAQCVMGRRYEPVAIGRLERFVGDWALIHQDHPAHPWLPTANRVAVIGAGPAGLTCAADLARMGHRVTIFEALHKAGGVLSYGIPEFRLPKQVVQAEVDYVKSLGVELRLNSVVGKLYTIDELLDEREYDALFLGTGAGLPRFLRIPGENCIGVLSANEFLTRANLMKAYRFPEYDTPVIVGQRVAVIGAGNVAMDSARCALRLGAQEANIVYRRSRVEMPARQEEVENAEAEGVRFELLANPVEIFGNDEGWVTGMRCIRMELGEPDASGRRRPIPIPGSEFDMEVDVVVVATGASPNPLVFARVEGLQRTRWGTVVADEETGRTNRERVWAGGDIVTGAATVISAMGAGKRSAADIDRFLRDPEADRHWRSPNSAAA
jgi:glutamate synthase (NADPH/NADH) small chain